ncbi:MAG: tetratricopeptide repeat protein [Planctomycetaceae bacterium]
MLNEAGPEERTSSQNTSAQRQRARLSRSRKLVFSLFMCVAFFGVLELILAAVGVQRILYEEDLYVGLSSRIPLYAESLESAGEMQTARNKLSFFNVQSFAQPKPPGTYRIFCVGGSTTFGRPYDDTTSYCGWLRELLATADPSHPWDVINAGGISYASYRVALLMEELVQYEPDLFLIYCGHNEFLEHRTYESVIATPAAVRGLGAILSGTRTFSALHRLVHAPSSPNSTELSGEVDTILDQSVGLDGYTRDDPLQQQVLAHYRYNMQRMIDIARSVGAEVMLVTPASNLRECAPFKSEHRAFLSEVEARRCQSLLATARTFIDAGSFQEGLTALDEANAIDDRHAELHYLRGRVLDHLGRHPEAKAEFVRARDEDVCPLRALTPMREIVAEVAAQNDVPLLDFVAIVEAQSDQSIPGENLFLDHVHPTIEGHRLLALELFDLLETQGILTSRADWNEEALAEVIETIEGRVDAQAHAHALSNLSQVLGWAGKRDEAGKLALQAVEMDLSNPEAQSLAGCEYARRGDFEQAQKHLERALELKPNPRVAVKACDNLGLVFAQQGKFAEAKEQFLQAIKIDPRSAMIYNNLGMIAAEQNDVAEAAEYFQQAVRIEPSYVMAHFNLGTALAMQGQFQAAEKQFERVVQLQPYYPQARASLAEVRAILQQR